MLQIVPIALAAIIVVFVIVVALKPADFRIARSASMSAPASAAFAQVNDFHNWNAWSPWAKLDPDVQNEFAGAPSGTGAVFRWSGNNKVGVGNMTILESRPNELIKIRLEFLKPFQAVHTAEFTFKPGGGQTMVTWSMYGKNNFMGKAMSLIMNCDKMIGGMFDKGLAQMKAVVEVATPPARQ